MARPIWKGVVSFGMVSIPVRLFPATSEKDFSFHLLHKEDNSRVKLLRWCPVDERALGPEEVVRGYEYAKDQYVVLTEEDFDKLPVPTKHTIELQSFVKREEIDPVYQDRSYYIEPDQAGTKPYALLFRALDEKRLVAMAKVTLRTKERLCSITPRNGILMVETLYYPDEIQMKISGKPPEVAVSKEEMEMAFAFIDLLAGPFEPEKYHDRYREALNELIEAKLRGQEVVEITPPSPPPVTDLMAALRASVEAAKRERPAELVKAVRKGREQKAA